MTVRGGDLILAINSGSSSLKFGLFRQQGDDEEAVLRGGVDGVGQQESKLQIEDSQGKTLVEKRYALPTQAHALGEIVNAVRKSSEREPVCVGHRIVHGGPHLRQHQQITPGLLEKLEAAIHFAPLHIPASLSLIKETERLFPKAPQFACFDTAFHAQMPEASRRFALPDELYDKGVERYGFHGLSYESILYRLRAHVPPRLICAHLGNGASLAAVRDGVSIDTSMGLTPTGGIPMATRSGDLDPGVLLFIMRSEKMDADALETMLNHESGLKALSGGESDMRQLQARAENGDLRAQLAIDVFCTAAKKFIGAYAAELGGLDLLVFTGGIGEHSEYIRKRICRGLEFLGVEISASGETTKVAVMPSEEEKQIARHCRAMLAA